jgi:hypothetical protein
MVEDEVASQQGTYQDRHPQDEAVSLHVNFDFVSMVNRKTTLVL